MNLEQLPDIFNVKQLKDYMQIGTAASYNLCRSKGFPAIFVGKSIRITKKGFEKWLEKQAPVN